MSAMEKLCVIMQPTYLPWSGYFNLISRADEFVFLDDVQFERRSWQSRNRILNHGKEALLTVPVCKHTRDTLVKDILISEESDWREKHLSTLQHAYKLAPFYADVYPLLEKILSNTRYVNLSDLNVGLIKHISNALGINTRFELASTLSCKGKRSEHLLNICKEVGASKYLSAQGSRQYIEEEGCFAASNVSVSYQEFVPASYKQMKTDAFVSHLSIVDVAMHMGWEYAKSYILR